MTHFPKAFVVDFGQVPSAINIDKAITTEYIDFECFIFRWIKVYVYFHRRTTKILSYLKFLRIVKVFLILNTRCWFS